MVVSVFLWAVLVLWELLIISGYSLATLGDEVPFLPAHAALDFLLLVPLFGGALVLAARCSRRMVRDPHPDPASPALTAAIASILLLLALGPASALRIAGHAAIDARASLPADSWIEALGSYCTFGRDPVADPNGIPATASSGPSPGTLVVQGFRAALMAQAILFPFLFVSCWLMHALRRRTGGAPGFPDGPRRRFAMGVSALAGVAARAAIGGSLHNSGRGSASARATKAVGKMSLLSGFIGLLVCCLVAGDETGQVCGLCVETRQKC